MMKIVIFLTRGEEYHNFTIITHTLFTVVFVCSC